MGCREPDSRVKERDGGVDMRHCGRKKGRESLVAQAWYDTGVKKRSELLSHILARVDQSLKTFPYDETGTLVELLRVLAEQFGESCSTQGTCIASTFEGLNRVYFSIFT